MALVTLSEVKTYLGISGTDSDDKLNAIISGMEQVVINSIWEIEEDTRSEQLHICDFKYDTIYLSNTNVTSIDTIGGTAYTGVLGTDYLIVWSNKVIFNDYKWTLDITRFNYVTVTYTAWYSTVPADIKLAMNMLVAQQFSMQDGQAIKQYKLWPRSVTYAWPDTEQANAEHSTVNEMLKKYKVIGKDSIC